MYIQGFLLGPFGFQVIIIHPGKHIFAFAHERIRAAEARGWRLTRVRCPFRRVFGRKSFRPKAHVPAAEGITAPDYSA